MLKRHYYYYFFVYYFKFHISFSHELSKCFSPYFYFIYYFYTTHILCILSSYLCINLSLLVYHVITDCFFFFIFGDCPREREKKKRLTRIKSRLTVRRRERKKSRSIWLLKFLRSVREFFFWISFLLLFVDHQRFYVLGRYKSHSWFFCNLLWWKFWRLMEERWWWIQVFKIKIGRKKKEDWCVICDFHMESW